MEKNAPIYVAGHRGLVGSAIVRALQKKGYSSILTRTRAELDLKNAEAVATFFEQHRPQYVFLAAAKVGGILANDTYPVDFLLENLAIQNNVISAAHRYGVRKLLFLGSSCIYPKFAPQPIPESALLNGHLEPTNEAYAIAKIAGIKLCQAYRKQYGCNFICAMPTNLYGPNDNYHPEHSHVIPALIRRFHEARINQHPTITIWGTGTPRREFLYSDDLADACLFLMDHYDDPEIINVGCGQDITIAELAHLIAKITGYTGKLIFDPSKPDGTPRKLLDISKIQALGWKATTPLEKGLEASYSDWLQKNQSLK
ncbi:MAG: GDP-L-fucose synthase [Methylacidiphilales bacterium]|nr:GDP-L-fucose synthase [Candidatus Methylacidiphilales bacterium]